MWTLELISPGVVACVPCSMWKLSSLTRDWTHTPCTGRWILNHWITREIPHEAHFYCTWSCGEREEGWRRQKHRDQGGAASTRSHVEKANRRWTWRSRITQPADFLGDMLFRCSCYDKTCPLFPVLQQKLLAGRLLLNSISDSKPCGGVGGTCAHGEQAASF